MLEEILSRRSFINLCAITAASLALDWSGKAEALAAIMGNKANYPVVVIGAGLGGLTAAAYLSKFGVPVTVVEQHRIPGGYATAFKRGDFTFDVSLHHTSINNNASAAMLKELGILDKLQLVSLPEQPRPEMFMEKLAKQFPAEREGIKGFINEITGVSEEISILSQKTGTRAKFPQQYPKLWNIKDKTLADLLGAYVKDSHLQDLLASGWGAYGLPPSRLSAFYFAAARGGSLRNGSVYIRPRSQELSNALVETITEAGGKVLYRAPAKKIRTQNGAVQGVELQDGKVLPALVVVSNASALTTFKMMLPPEAVPADYLTKLNKYSPSISSFIIWLGLNQDVRGILKRYRTGFRTGRGPEADYQLCMNGIMEQAPYAICLYDHLFEGYSRPGKSTLTILSLCGYEPWRKFESYYRLGQKSAYYKEKKRQTMALITRAEKDFIPGLSSMIEVKEAATPLTNWHYTGNPQGAIYGFDQTLDNTFMNRLDCRTPVKGLYLASAWANPGGGYGGAMSSGQKAFRMIVEDWGRQLRRQ